MALHWFTLYNVHKFYIYFELKRRHVRWPCGQQIGQVDFVRVCYTLFLPHKDHTNVNIGTNENELYNSFNFFCNSYNINKVRTVLFFNCRSQTTAEQTVWGTKIQL